MLPHVKVIWHDHFGAYDTERRRPLLYRIAATRLATVIAVSQPLADWAGTALHLPADKVKYIPNFVTEPPASPAIPDVPGTKGSRIVCVANLRPQKDHLTLLAAMAMVATQRPDAHLILLGGSVDAAYTEHLQRVIANKGLQTRVSWLGSHPNVPAILKECSIGVLSSASEGLPLALLEYGMAGLPTVATRVGQNAEVLDHGTAGIIVPPSDPVALAEAILSLLRSDDLARSLSGRFSSWVRDRYGAHTRIADIVELYDGMIPPVGGPEGRHP